MSDEQKRRDREQDERIQRALRKNPKSEPCAVLAVVGMALTVGAEFASRVFT